LYPRRTSIAGDGEDVASILVAVQDIKGRVVPTASNLVRFTLAGPGKIIGVGNGDPSCREAGKPDSFQSAQRSAFNGSCMVFVQAEKHAGAIQLEASADGLDSVQAAIQSQAATLRPAVD
jgi:beta-galactosidase